MIERSSYAILLLTLSGTTAAVSIAQPLPAQGIKAIDFNIAPQSLSSALLEYSRQTGEVVVVPADLIEDMRTQGVKGRMTYAAALDRLLAGTGLKSRRDASGGLTLERVSPPFAENMISQGAVPDIVVVGSRSQNVDIRRTRDDAQPYVVFDAAELRQSQAATVDEFLKSRLPMNSIAVTSQQQPAGVSNQSEINLRGLGANQTLILVDGRRRAAPLVTSGGQNDFGQPDLNGIPINAIERIEILPSGAGGIYGGGATGGVVNIILKHNYRGFEAGFTYGDTGDFKAGNRRYDLSGGFSIGGSTNVTFSASHHNSDPLLTGERDFAARGRALQLRNRPEAFYEGQPPVGYTTNIASASGGNLLLQDGTRLNAAMTSVPVGYAGPSSDGGAALVANAGKYNLGLPDDLTGTRSSLLSAPRITSLSANIEHRFSGSVRAFVDASYSDNSATALVPAAGSGYVNFPGGVANPFTVDGEPDTPIVVSFPVPNVVALSRGSSKTLGLTGGLVIALGGGWTLTTDHAWSRSSVKSQGSIPSFSLAGYDAIGDGQVDLLRDLNRFPVDFSPYLIPQPAVVNEAARATLNDTNLRLSGPLLKLPGGQLTFTALLEHRNQQATEVYSRDYDVGVGAAVYRYRPARSQQVDSAYAELRAPILSPENGVSFANKLEISASVRHDRYRTNSFQNTFITLAERSDPADLGAAIRTRVNATKFTAGGLWAPVPDLQLRASYATSFLPPSINQIAPDISNSYFEIIDPLRGNESYVTLIQLTSGGNPGLTPEQSRSWSAGVVLTPRFAKGLRLSADYTSISKEDEIRVLDFDYLIQNASQFPGRVTRADPSPDDPAGYAGLVTGVDRSLLNLARTKVTALDFQGDYTLRSEATGEFRGYIVATRQLHFKTQALSTLPFVDDAGFLNASLKWRGNGGVTWSRGGITLGWNAQYYDSYLVYGPTTDAGLRATLVKNQGAARIPSQMYHDLLATYRFGPAGGLGNKALANVTVAFGVQNVFDKNPPIIATVGTTGGYSTYGDPRLRRFTLSARKSF